MRNPFDHGASVRRAETTKHTAPAISPRSSGLVVRLAAAAIPIAQSHQAPGWSMRGSRPVTPTPIDPYSHVAKAGNLIWIGATAGVNPATGQLAGPDIESQTLQILESFSVMLGSVGSDLAHVIHINIFLKEMGDFEAMNAAYVQRMGNHRPARTVIGVRELPKPGVLLTMNLTAVTND